LKGSRETHHSNEYRKDVQRKRKFSVNQWDREKKEFTAKVMKKLENYSNL